MVGDNKNRKSGNGKGKEVAPPKEAKGSRSKGKEVVSSSKGKEVMPPEETKGSSSKGKEVMAPEKAKGSSSRAGSGRFGGDEKDAIGYEKDNESHSDEEAAVGMNNPFAALQAGYQPPRKPTATAKTSHKISKGDLAGPSGSGIKIDQGSPKGPWKPRGHLRTTPAGGRNPIGTRQQAVPHGPGGPTPKTFHDSPSGPSFAKTASDVFSQKPYAHPTVRIPGIRSQSDKAVSAEPKKSTLSYSAVLKGDSKPAVPVPTPVPVPVVPVPVRMPVAISKKKVSGKEDESYDPTPVETEKWKDLSQPLPVFDDGPAFDWADDVDEEVAAGGLPIYSENPGSSSKGAEGLGKKQDVPVEDTSVTVKGQDIPVEDTKMTKKEHDELVEDTNVTKMEQDVLVEDTNVTEEPEAPIEATNANEKEQDMPFEDIIVTEQEPDVPLQNTSGPEKKEGAPLEDTDSPERKSETPPEDKIGTEIEPEAPPQEPEAPHQHEEGPGVPQVDGAEGQIKEPEVSPQAEEGPETAPEEAPDDTSLIQEPGTPEPEAHPQDEEGPEIEPEAPPQEQEAQPRNEEGPEIVPQEPQIMTPEPASPANVPDIQPAEAAAAAAGNGHAAVPIDEWVMGAENFPPPPDMNPPPWDPPPPSPNGADPALNVNIPPPAVVNSFYLADALRVLEGELVHVETRLFFWSNELARYGNGTGAPRHRREELLSRVHLVLGRMAELERSIATIPVWWEPGNHGVPPAHWNQGPPPEQWNQGPPPGQLNQDAQPGHWNQGPAPEHWNHEA